MKRLRGIAAVILSVWYLVSGGLLGLFPETAFASERRAAEQTQENETETETELQIEEVPQFQEDFRELYEQNPDIAGWLRVGEAIDEPVLYRDNSYYLSHGFDGAETQNGAIFLNEANLLFPRDQVLLIHGHNMKSGAMFGRLRLYADASYASAHPLIIFRTIYDPGDVYYVPVYALDASMNEGQEGYLDITPLCFSDEEEYAAYLETLEKRSYWLSPVEVGTQDELIMLITCSYLHENGRFLLVCRKLREDETPGQMEEEYATLIEMSTDKGA